MNNKLRELCFDGSGGLLHYYLGVAKYIKENFNLDNIIFTGRSGGCIIIILLALNIEIDMIIEEIKIAANKIKIKNSFGLGIIIPKLIEVIEKSCLKKKKKLTICNEKINFHITKVTKYIPFKYENLIISEWQSYEEVLECLKCAIHIPIYSKKLFFNYNGSKYIDGAVLGTISNKFTHRDLSIGKYDKSIEINLSKWRDVKSIYPFFMMNLNANFIDKLVNYGYNDAEKNKNELEIFFKST